MIECIDCSIRIYWEEVENFKYWFMCYLRVMGSFLRRMISSNILNLRFDDWEDIDKLEIDREGWRIGEEL